MSDEQIVEATGSPVSERIGWLTWLVSEELRSALTRFASFNSPHEGKAVIEEELDELWAHVKANTGRGPASMEEAIQVAAMALRYVYDLAAWGPGFPALDTATPSPPSGSSS